MEQPSVDALPDAKEVAGGDRYFEHLKKINDTFYDQIKIADQKAAFIFTFMLAFLVTSPEGRDVFKLERYLTAGLPSALLSAVLALAATVALVCAVLVVLPRHRATPTSLYWGSWETSAAALVAARDSGDEAYVFNEYLANAGNLSAINRSKYRFVRLAFRSLFVTVVAYVLILALR